MPNSEEENLYSHEIVNTDRQGDEAIEISEDFDTLDAAIDSAKAHMETLLTDYNPIHIDNVLHLQNKIDQSKLVCISYIQTERYFFALEVISQIATEGYVALMGQTDTTPVFYVSYEPFEC